MFPSYSFLKFAKTCFTLSKKSVRFFAVSVDDLAFGAVSPLPDSE